MHLIDATFGFIFLFTNYVISKLTYMALQIMTQHDISVLFKISRILSTYDGKLRQLFKTTLKTYLVKKREVYCCKYRSSWSKLFWYSVALFLSKLSLSHFTSLEVCDKVVKVLTEQKSYNKDNFTHQQKSVYIFLCIKYHKLI